MDSLRLAGFIFFGLHLTMAIRIVLGKGFGTSACVFRSTGAQTWEVSAALPYDLEQ